METSCWIFVVLTQIITRATCLRNTRGDCIEKRTAQAIIVCIRVTLGRCSGLVPAGLLPFVSKVPIVRAVRRGPTEHDPTLAAWTGGSGGPGIFPGIIGGGGGAGAAEAHAIATAMTATKRDRIFGCCLRVTNV